MLPYPPMKEQTDRRPHKHILGEVYHHTLRIQNETRKDKLIIDMNKN